MKKILHRLISMSWIIAISSLALLLLFLFLKVSFFLIMDILLVIFLASSAVLIAYMLFAAFKTIRIKIKEKGLAKALLFLAIQYLAMVFGSYLLTLLFKTFQPFPGIFIGAGLITLVTTADFSKIKEKNT